MQIKKILGWVESCEEGRKEFTDKSMEEVASWLKDHGISEVIANTFEGKLFIGELQFIHFLILLIENEVDGDSFLEFTEEDIQKLLEPLGIIKKISKHLKSLKLQV